MMRGCSRRRSRSCTGRLAVGRLMGCRPAGAVDGSGPRRIVHGMAGSRCLGGSVGWTVATRFLVRTGKMDRRRKCAGRRHHQRGGRNCSVIRSGACRLRKLADRLGRRAGRALCRRLRVIRRAVVGGLGRTCRVGRIGSRGGCSAPCSGNLARVSGRNRLHGLAPRCRRFCLRPVRFRRGARLRLSWRAGGRCRGTYRMIVKVC